MRTQSNQLRLLAGTNGKQLPQEFSGVERCSPCFAAAGFEKPSAIQQKGIVPFTKGLDVIQQAQSGTGKTATFCAGILNNLDYQNLECQV